MAEFSQRVRKTDRQMNRQRKTDWDLRFLVPKRRNE